MKDMFVFFIFSRSSQPKLSEKNFFPKFTNILKTICTLIHSTKRKKLQNLFQCAFLRTFLT